MARKPKLSLDDSSNYSSEKRLDISDTNSAKKNIPDLNHFGNPDSFKLISKTWSKNQGWMKSTKGLEVKGVGVVLSTCTQQRNSDGTWSLSEASTFVPGVTIKAQKNEKGEVVGRELTHYTV